MHFFLFPRSARQSHNSLEERTRDIEALKMEMDQLQDKFSGLNKSFLRSVKQTLQESDIPGEDKEVGTRKLIVTVFAPHSSCFIPQASLQACLCSTGCSPKDTFLEISIIEQH